MSATAVVGNDRSEAVRRQVRRFEERFIKIATEIERAVENAAPRIKAFGKALVALDEAPGVEGYQEFYRRNGYEPLMAKVMTRITLRLGEKRFAEIIAERDLSSAVSKLAHAKGASTLVISRRAVELDAILAHELASTPLDAAFEASGLREERYWLRRTVSQAIGRSTEACGQLTTLCEQLKPHLGQAWLHAAQM